MEQVVTQLQQEVNNLSAQVAAESGLPDAVRAVNNLATAQVRKDTPSLIDVEGLGRPKEFTGREEDFQQWSKKTEAFFAGVIKESEMMLVWANKWSHQAYFNGNIRLKERPASSGYGTQKHHITEVMSDHSLSS